jgi:hypothetical protein
MVADLWVYQLMLVGLLWLVVMLYSAGARRWVVYPAAAGNSDGPLRSRSRCVNQPVSRMVEKVG